MSGFESMPEDISGILFARSGHMPGTKYKDMEFRVVNKQTEEIFHEILRRIHRLQSGGTIDSLRDIGADTGKQIGASYVSLKTLASTYKPDEQLAFLLWNTSRREEQIIACMLFPLDLNKEKITQLSKSCLNFEIAGYLGSLYLCKHPELSTSAQEWLDTETPYLQLATLSALARHLIIYKDKSQITEEFFANVVHKNYPDRYVSLAAERYRFNI